MRCALLLCFLLTGCATAELSPAGARVGVTQKAREGCRLVETRREAEARLGRKPRFGAWDTAFGAQYVYQYFHDAGGFAEAAVRVSEVAACCGCA